MANQCKSLILAFALVLYFCSASMGASVERVGKIGSRFVFKVDGVVVSVSEGDSIDGCTVGRSGLECDNNANVGFLVQDLEKKVTDAEAKAADAVRRYELLVAKLNSVVVTGGTVSDPARAAVPPPPVSQLPVPAPAIQTVAASPVIKPSTQDLAPVSSSQRFQKVPVTVRPRGQDLSVARREPQSVMVPAPAPKPAEQAHMAAPASMSSSVRIPIRSLVKTPVLSGPPISPAPAPPAQSSRVSPGNGDVVASLKALVDGSGRTISVDGIGDVRYATLKDKIIVRASAQKIRQVEAIFGTAIQQEIKGDGEYYLMVPVSFLDDKL